LPLTNPILVCPVPPNFAPALAGECIVRFEGIVTQEKTKSMLTAVELYLDQTAENAGVRRKLIHVMVESLQNIARHSEKTFEGTSVLYTSIFLLNRKPHGYTIFSGNPVTSVKVDVMTEALQKINSLDQQGQRKKYLDSIQSPCFMRNGGAGIGLVDMARRSGEKLKFNFQVLSKNYSFFWLMVGVSRKL
jgi:hypothetical protein